MKTLKKIAAMRYAVCALMAFCLCLPLVGDDAAKKKFEETKAKAEKGDASAQLNLGYMYFSGKGVPNGQKEAAKWIRKAAEQGLATAQSIMGAMYANGNGVLKDDKEAVKWYRKALNRRRRAQTSLGAMYYNGGGILEDYETAYAWINIAVANGNSNAEEYKPLIEKKLFPKQIAKAQELSKEMIKKNPKLINE